MASIHRASPPAAAIRLLCTGLPAVERETVVGDLIEMFEDRRDAGRHFNQTWFWAQALLFAAAARSEPLRSSASGSRRFGMGRFTNGGRHSLRGLRREWRYTAAVIGILGIGIGPAAAMLSVVQRVLLRPLDYREPDRLGLIRINLGAIHDHPGLSPAEAIDLRKSGLFAQVETETRLNEVSYGPPDRLIPLSQLNFTTGMLPMLGVTPVMGRNFTEDDLPLPPAPPAPGVPPAAAPRPVQKALLDYMAWQTQFGGDKAIIGRVIQINNGPTEIIGVLPRGFQLVTGRAVPQRIDIYTPYRLTDFRNAWQFPTFVSLAPGVSFASAQAGLDTLSKALSEKYPEVYNTGLRFTVLPVLDDLTRGTKPALRAATGGVLLLLVIAFANATALVVARLRSRERDVAIRSAIGASRAALISDAITESVLLGLGGAAIGSVMAAGAVAGLRALMPHTVPRWEDISVGWDLVAFSAVLALAGLVVSGLIPVFRVSRGATFVALREGAVNGGRAEGATARLVLVGAQIALTVVLAFGCAELVRSAERLRHVDLGYDPNVLTVRVPIDFRRYSNPGDLSHLYQRVRDRVRQVPGVTSVGVVTHLPLSGSTMADGYTTDLTKEPSFDQSANYQAVTAGYFATLRIPILQGRDFTDQEDAESQNVIIVDDTLARTVFPGATDVLGRTLRLGWGLPNATIVGVVGHARTIDVGKAVRPQIYAPVGNLFQNAGFVTVRSSGDPRALGPAIVSAINEVGPGRAVSNVTMLTENVTAATSTLVAVTGLVAFLAISAGILSAIGLYLVIAFVVHERRRSTAIRTALGATKTQIMWQQARTSGAVLLIALPAGVLLSLAVAPLFADLIYGIGARDAGSLVIAIVAAAMAGTLGTYLPVVRAANANIVKILRGD
jgi:predicted permease